MSALNLAACTRAPYIDLDRIRRTIDEGPYDAVLALAPENVPYYSGFYNIDLRLLPERLHVCIWPRAASRRSWWWSGGPACCAPTRPT